MKIIRLLSIKPLEKRKWKGRMQGNKKRQGYGERGRGTEKDGERGRYTVT